MRAVRAAHEAASGECTTKGGSDLTIIRAEISGWPRAGQSAEAERDCGERDDPSRVPRADARSQEARRDQERGRATPEKPFEHESGQDGEQHPDGAERV